MSRNKNCKKNPAKIARIKRAKERQEAFEKLSPAERAAQKAANKARYDAQR